MGFAKSFKDRRADGFVKEGADLSIQPANGLLLNDTPIESPQVIYAGDRITIGSDSLLAITVVQ